MIAPIAPSRLPVRPSRLAIPPLLVVLALACAAASAQVFTPAGPGVAPAVPPWGSNFGVGCAWSDFDGDGDQDLFVPHGLGGGYDLHLRQASGWSIVAVAPYPGLQNDRGCAAADFDNDGDVDVFVASGPGVPNRLFVNQGGGVFTEEAAARGVAAPADDARNASWGDLDRDGFLDLYVANYLTPPAVPAANRLFRNDGAGSFIDVTAAAGCAAPGFGLACVIWDVDRDGWPDIYVGNDHGASFMPNALLKNMRNGTFTDVSTALNAHAAIDCMGIAVGDVANDGDWDLFLTGNASTNAYLRWDAQIPGFAPQASWGGLANAMGLTTPLIAWGTFFFDADHDRFLDLAVIASNGPFALWRGTASGGFVNVANAGGLASVLPFGFTACPIDFDDDGDLDIWYPGGIFPGHLAVNQTPTPNHHWISVLLRGTLSNRDAIGAVVIVKTAQGQQRRPRISGDGYLCDGDDRLFFGLGTATAVDEIEVRWPSGTVSYVTAPPVDQHLQIVEPAFDFVGPMTPGTTALVQTHLAADASIPWISGLTTSVFTEHPLGDGRAILVDLADPLLAITAAPGNGVLVGAQGFVQANGDVAMNLVIPPVPQLSGYSLWIVGLTWHPLYGSFIKSIVGPQRFTIQ